MEIEVFNQLANMLESGGDVGIWVLAYFVYQVRIALNQMDKRIDKLEWSQEHEC